MERVQVPSSARLTLGQALLLAGLVALVVLFYLRLASVLPYGQVSQQAQLAVEPPFVYRLLLPWLLGQLLPQAWLDTVVLRTAVTALSVAACFGVFPAYAARVLGSAAGGLRPERLWVGLAVVLVAHYGIPRPYCFWYVYDIPAIAFYMVAFMAMTRHEGRVSWWCVPLLALLSLNRETVVVAALHATAWHLCQPRVVEAQLLWRMRALTILKPVALPLVAAIGALFLVRLALVQGMGHGVASVAALHDGEQLRFVAGFARMLSKPDHALALLLIGAGALVWLPVRWRRLPAPVQVLLLASLPALAMFLAVGNVVELRMYGELVPVLALGIGWAQKPK